MLDRTAPKELTREPENPLWALASTAAPVMLLGFFAMNHLSHWVQTGNIVGVGLAVQETVLVALFLIRRTPNVAKNTFTAWTAALIGTFGVMLVLPDGHVVFGAGNIYTAVQIVGALLVTAAVLSLGRSFGLVAANRGVKTTGAYAVVRHPIYASYLVGYLGYFLAAASIWNFAVIGIALAFQVKRIHIEESLLMEDPEYREYAASVRYRIIPGIY